MRPLGERLAREGHVSLLLVVALCFVLVQAVAAVNWAGLAKDLDPATKQLGSWLANRGPCDDPPFKGVQCDNNKNVVAINLQNLNLNGQLTDKIAALTALTALLLSSNWLQGNVPPSIGQLTNLQDLELCCGNLQGPLPPLGALTALTHLDVRRNQLSGNLPPDLGALKELQYLDLSRNKLTGPVSARLGDLKKLQTLLLNGNLLQGALPPAVADLAANNVARVNLTQQPGATLCGAKGLNLPPCAPVVEPKPKPTPSPAKKPPQGPQSQPAPQPRTVPAPAPSVAPAPQTAPPAPPVSVPANASAPTSSAGSNATTVTSVAEQSGGSSSPSASSPLPLPAIIGTAAGGALLLLLLALCLFCCVRSKKVAAAAPGTPSPLPEAKAGDLGGDLGSKNGAVESMQHAPGGGAITLSVAAVAVKSQLAKWSFANAAAEAPVTKDAAFSVQPDGKRVTGASNLPSPSISFTSSDENGSEAASATAATSPVLKLLPTGTQELSDPKISNASPETSAAALPTPASAVSVAATVAVATAAIAAAQDRAVPSVGQEQQALRSQNETTTFPQEGASHESSGDPAIQGAVVPPGVAHQPPLQRSLSTNSAAQPASTAPRGATGSPSSHRARPPRPPRGMSPVHHSTAVVEAEQQLEEPAVPFQPVSSGPVDEAAATFNEASRQTLSSGVASGWSKGSKGREATPTAGTGWLGWWSGYAGAGTASGTSAANETGKESPPFGVQQTQDQDQECRDLEEAEEGQDHLQHQFENEEAVMDFEQPQASEDDADKQLAFGRSEGAGTEGRQWTISMEEEQELDAAARDTAGKSVNQGEAQAEGGPSWKTTRKAVSLRSLRGERKSVEKSVPGEQLRVAESQTTVTVPPAVPLPVLQSLSSMHLQASPRHPHAAGSSSALRTALRTADPRPLDAGSADGEGACDSARAAPPAALPEAEDDDDTLPLQLTSSVAASKALRAADVLSHTDSAKEGFFAAAACPASIETAMQRSMSEASGAVEWQLLQSVGVPSSISGRVYFDPDELGVPMQGAVGCPLGAGRYGSVFKGSLPDGTPVAVKRLPHAPGGEGGSSYALARPVSSTFRARVEELVNLRHRNLIALLGCCCSADDGPDAPPRMLVYEFAANGALPLWLHSLPAAAPAAAQLREAGETAARASAAAAATASAALSSGVCVTEPLDWALRIHLALGCARGLQYLHENNIVHGDVKAGNVLLDSSWTARLSDSSILSFTGLAGLPPTRPNHTGSACGTPGYIAPEVSEAGLTALSDKSDVFSFGVLLLELVTGRAATDITLPSGHLHGWVAELMDDQERQGSARTSPLLSSVLDVRLQWAILRGAAQPVAEEDLAYVLGVALRCCAASPAKRPRMKQVVHMLESEDPMLQATWRPQQPNLFNAHEAAAAWQHGDTVMAPYNSTSFSQPATYAPISPYHRQPSWSAGGGALSHSTAGPLFQSHTALHGNAGASPRFYPHSSSIPASPSASAAYLASPRAALSSAGYSSYASQSAGPVGAPGGSHMHPQQHPLQMSSPRTTMAYSLYSGSPTAAYGPHFRPFSGATAAQGPSPRWANAGVAAAHSGSPREGPSVLGGAGFKHGGRGVAGAGSIIASQAMSIASRSRQEYK